MCFYTCTIRSVWSIFATRKMRSIETKRIKGWKYTMPRTDEQYINACCYLEEKFDWHKNEEFSSNFES